MIKDAGGELVAYSVQELGGAWRWRVYGPAGQVISQGVEATEARAMQAAAALMLGAVAARVVRPVAVRGMLAH
ncbi:MAG: hypothetical protein JO303_02110 [Caulobacteraceae bacterium]|nr:hypothetical protein [Caulobacteraceae bacterium]